MKINSSACRSPLPNQGGNISSLLKGDHKKNKFKIIEFLTDDVGLPMNVANDAFKIFSQPDLAANDFHLPTSKLEESIAGAIAFWELKSIFPELQDINRPMVAGCNVDFVVNYEIDGIECQIGIDPFIIPSTPHNLQDDNFRKLLDRHTLSIKSLEVEAGITIGVGHYGLSGNQNPDYYSPLRNLEDKENRYLFIIDNFDCGISYRSFDENIDIPLEWRCCINPKA